MPTVRYVVRNEYGLAAPELYQAAEKDDPEAILEGIAMAGLVGVLRQLGDLAEFAAEIFHDLHEEVIVTAARGHGMMLRIQQLEAEFPSIEKSLLSQTDLTLFSYNTGIDWHANLPVDQNLVTRGDLPRFILDSYEECHGPPRLFMLDKFDNAGAGGCLKRYSDPSFFKICSNTSEIDKIEVQIEKKVCKIKKKVTNWRNGETPEALLLLQSSSNSERLISSIVSEKVPAKRVKLKSRKLKDLSTDNGMSYMAHLLEVAFVEQNMLVEDSVASFPKIKSSDSNELSDAAQEVPMDTLPDNSLNANQVPFVSSLNQELEVSLTKKMNNENIGDNDKVMEASQETVCEEGKEAVHNMDHNIEFYEVFQKEFSQDSLHKVKNSAQSNIYEDVASDLENYVDALNTDSGNKPKQNTDHSCVDSTSLFGVQSSEELIFENSVSRTDVNVSSEVKPNSEEKAFSQAEDWEVGYLVSSSASSANIFDKDILDISSIAGVALDDAVCPHSVTKSGPSEPYDSTTDVFHEKEDYEMRTRLNFLDDVAYGDGQSYNCTPSLQVREVCTSFPFTYSASSIHSSTHENTEDAQKFSEEQKGIPVGLSKGSPKIGVSPNSSLLFEAAEASYLSEVSGKSIPSVTIYEDSIGSTGKTIDFEVPPSAFSDSIDGVSILYGLNVACEVSADTSIDKNVNGFGCSNDFICASFPDPSPLRPDLDLIIPENAADASEDRTSDTSLVPEHKDDDSVVQNDEPWNIMMHLHEEIADDDIKINKSVLAIDHHESTINKCVIEPDNGDALVFSLPSQDDSCVGEDEWLHQVTQQDSLSFLEEAILENGILSSFSDNQKIDEYVPPQVADNCALEPKEEDCSQICDVQEPHKSDVDEELPLEGTTEHAAVTVSPCEEDLIVFDQMSCSLHSDQFPGIPQSDLQKEMSCLDSSIETWHPVQEDDGFTSGDIIVDKDKADNLEPNIGELLIMEGSDHLEHESEHPSIQPATVICEHVCYNTPILENIPESSSKLDSIEPSSIFPSDFTEETPPLPPLPPIEWRIGKLKLGSLNTLGGMTPLHSSVAVYDKQDFTSSESSEAIRSCLLVPQASEPVLENVCILPGIARSDGSMMQHLSLIDLTQLDDCSVCMERVVKDEENSKYSQASKDPKANARALSGLPPISAGESDELTAPVVFSNSLNVDVNSEEEMKMLQSTNSMGYSGECTQQLNLLMAQQTPHPRVIDREVLCEYIANPYMSYKVAIPALGDDPPLRQPRSIRDWRRTPLTEAIASHDKSKMRKVSELERPSAKLENERNTLLEQIRNKSFSLKPAVAMKPSTNGPTTNIKVAAILEKANAIRQACVGSDEGSDDDRWSDA